MSGCNKIPNILIRKVLHRTRSVLAKPQVLVAAFLMTCVIYMMTISNQEYLDGEYLESEDIYSNHLVSQVKNTSEDHIHLNLSFTRIMANPKTLFLEQDEDWLIEFIKKNYLDQPSEGAYNLENPLENAVDDPSYWQGREVFKLLDEKKKGIFVACGAHDGEYLSNTLALEKLHGWTGALIEANPIIYSRLKSKHRKAWTIPACLSPFPYPKKMLLKLNDALSQLTLTDITEKEGFEDVQCFPLYSIMLALNMTKIDYLSLDVEGNELDILKTVPWDKVEIKTMTVEFNHIRQGKSALKKFMANQGYDIHIDGAKTSYKENVDILFVNRKYLK